MSCVQNSNTNGPCPNWAFSSSTNRLTTSGFSYDAAGNLTNDASNPTGHTYQWDAEGRVAAVDPANNPPTWTFTYNALGQRVQWVSPSGTYEHMFDPNGGWLGIYGVLDVLKWGDGAYAWYNGSETYFHHINHLSSTTMMTNHAGTAVEDMVFYPWGNVWQSWGSGGYNFAELPYYDPNTSTSPTLYRLYSMNVGRWHSPDPLGKGAVKPDDPQTWNMYAYVRNSPTTLVDPEGTSYCAILTSTAASTTIDAQSCVSDDKYWSNPDAYAGFQQVSEDVTILVISNLSSQNTDTVTFPTVLLTPGAIMWNARHWPPRGSTIQQQPPPERPRPASPAEAEMMSVGCAANAAPGLITNNANEPPGSYPGQEVDLTAPIYYGPTVRSTGPLKVPMANPNPEAMGVNEMAGSLLWFNNMLGCKAGVINGH